MSITLFIYRRCLEIVHKGALSRIAAFLGMSISKSASKPSMVGDTNSYVKSNWADVLENCVWRNWNWLEKFIKAGPDTPVVKASRWNHDTLKMLLWTFVYYDKRTRKENLLIAGDFDDKEPDGTDGNIELSPTTKYSMTSNLVKAVCELHYNS